MFFDRLDPADTDPARLVGRAEDRHWLSSVVHRYLALGGPPVGRAFCVTGGKGVGKSILIRSVLASLDTDAPEGTVVVSVDCSACHGRRGVLEAVANGVVRGLDALEQRSGGALALLAAAQVARTLTRFDDLPLRVAHEQLRPFHPALDEGATPHLFAALRLGFGLTFSLTDKQIKRLTGALRLDDAGLTEVWIGLLTDLRAHGLQVLLVLDNLDALRHDEAPGPGHDQVRRAVEGILALKAAPIGLLLGLRTYALGVLPRDISNTRALRPLPAEALQAILTDRLAQERAALRDQLATADGQGALACLLRMAPTPRALLRWVKFLFEAGRLRPDALEAGFQFFVESDYAPLDLELLRRVAWSFPTADAAVADDALLAACEGDRFVLDQLQDREVLLPRDVWSAETPRTLDPELVFLHPVVWGEGAAP